MFDGQLVQSETDEQGVTFTYSHDAAARVSERTRVGTGAIGALTTKFTYNALNQITEERVGLGFTEQMVTSRTYNDAGLLAVRSGEMGYS